MSSEHSVGPQLEMDTDKYASLTRWYGTTDEVLSDDVEENVSVIRYDTISLP